MYAIKETTVYANGLRIESYFVRIGLWGLREFASSIKNAKQFKTKKEASGVMSDLHKIDRNGKYGKYEIIKL